MTRLTEKAVLRAKPRKSKYEISCSVLTGFMLRVLPSGKKAYYVRYRDDRGKDLRVRLGATTELSFAEATALASEKLCSGESTPSVRAPASRSSRDARRALAPTFAEFAPRFLVEHANVRCKLLTQQKYRQMTNRNILPVFGGHRLDEVEVSDVTRFHASMNQTPLSANVNQDTSNQ